MPISATFLTIQIAAIEAQITAINAALLAFDTTNVQSYTLDTGQSRQVISRANITEMNRRVNSLLNQLEILCARRDGGGVVGRPDF